MVIQPTKRLILRFGNRLEGLIEKEKGCEHASATKS